MTQTRLWLEAQRRELIRRELGSGFLLAIGLSLSALAFGVLLARTGIYRVAPPFVLLGWAAVLAGFYLCVRWYRSRSRRIEPSALAHRLEQAAGLRRGSIAGIAEGFANNTSSSLAAMADGETLRWLEEDGASGLARVKVESSRWLRRSAGAAFAGALLFGLAGPTSGSGAGFWRPLSVITRSLGPVTLAVDHEEVSRGDSITVSVAAAGSRTATLWVRVPGEKWSSSRLVLDTAGQNTLILGPLESDLFIRATSGARSSDTIHVRVALPPLLTELSLVARYPSYLGRPHDPLAPGDTVLLPVGTVIGTHGRATVPLDSAAWRGLGGRVELSISGNEFSGALPVTRDGNWVLVVLPALHQPPVRLRLITVADSVPQVSVPIPGADTTAPTTLRQPIVIDVRDDHLVTRVEVISRRVSRFGLSSQRITEEVPLPAAGVSRAVLQWVLDLNERGFLPGDTAFFQVRVFDNAPEAQFALSPEYSLRLPSMRELRDRVRERSQSVSEAADSLTDAQRELARAMEDLAAERSVDAGEGARPGAERSAQQLPFNSAERARQLEERQQRLLDRVRDLREEVRQISEAAWNAGITDPEWHRQLAELRELLERAVTAELREKLRELREALERLDAPAARRALQELVEEQRELREALERSRELYERAAVEGEMTNLAEDAEELERQQEQWNRAMERTGDTARTALAQVESALADDADSLAQRIEALNAALESMGRGRDSNALEGVREQVDSAAQDMRQARSRSLAGNRSGALRAGRSATRNLAPVAEDLRAQRDALRSEWRQEVLGQLDYALAETADLARQQADLADRLSRGESGADARGDQAALRDGVNRVIQRVQSAAGKNALVSPRLSTSLGFARLRMTEALLHLQQGRPDTRQAADLASQALDGLNAVAHALMRSRGDVAGAESGSGLQEAIARMAQLATEQGALSGQTADLLPLMPTGGERLMEELRALAERQRSVARELDRLQAEGNARAPELAEEARELARQLDSGQLDRELVERQERLFRRLLDAGRTLRGNEEDERRERQSVTARDDNVRVPDPLDSNAVGKGPRYPYPSWEELRNLSPELRRLILDYFRRLNDAARP